MRIVLCLLPAFLATGAQAGGAASASEESPRTAFDRPASNTASDYITLPSERREFASRRGDYLFVLLSEDSWTSKRAQGELYTLERRERRLLWRQPLPQEFGPRYVVIGDEGQVLMLDEWINVKSRHAIVLVRKDGAVVVRRAFTDVRDILGADEATLVERGSQGSWWISAEPGLDGSGRFVSVPAGDETLLVDLATGDLSRR